MKRKINDAEPPAPQESPRPPRARITITCRTGGSVTLPNPQPEHPCPAALGSIPSPPPATNPSTLDPLITETDHAPDQT